MQTSSGFFRYPGKWRAPRFLAVCSALMMLAACGQADSGKAVEGLRREVQDLKAEVTTLKDQVSQLEAGQEAILALLKKEEAGKTAIPLRQQPGVAPTPLSVGQLLKNKDHYLGTRVTIRGVVGPVLMHHKSLLLKAPEGMVEVSFGNLGDKKLVDRLTSTPLNHPLTVTGVVSLPPSSQGAQLRITAEDVEF
jgi:hypothetical protein